MRYTPPGDAMLASLSTLETPPREFTGHTSDVWAVAFSSDGKYLVTGSKDKTARLWDLATGQIIRVFSGDTIEFGAVAFSPDGKYLITAGGEQEENGQSHGPPMGCRQWSDAQGLLRAHRHREFRGFSPDGKYIVTAGSTDKTVRIWDVATGQTLHVLSGLDVIDVAFSPDGKYVLTGSFDEPLAFGMPRTAAKCESSQVIRIMSTQWRLPPTAKYVATASEDATARLWDAATGQFVREFSDHRGLVAHQVSPDGRFLLTANEDRTAQLWDVASGQSVRVFSGQGVLSGVACSLTAAWSPPLYAASDQDLPGV